MYFKNWEELRKNCPIQNGEWNREILYEYLVWSCNINFSEQLHAFFHDYQNDKALAELLFDFLFNDYYDDSDCQIGAAYYLAKMDDKILKKLFVLEDMDDDYMYYHPFKPVQIFGFELDPSEYEINIATNYGIKEILPTLLKYVKWLSYCKDTITKYFSSELGEDLPDDWFESIEVFDASLTFISLEDFEATITFGESVLCDHTIEFDFDKFEIVNNRLNG